MKLIEQRIRTALKNDKVLLNAFKIVLLVNIGILILWALSNIAPSLKKSQSFIKTDSRKEAEQIHKACKDKGREKERCYTDQFTLLTNKTTRDYAEQTLSALFTVDRSTKDCHLMAYAIALSETAKNAAQWKEILTHTNTNMCSAGFVHGVIEGRRKYDSSFKLNSQTIPEFCTDRKKPIGGEFTCINTLGHILLAQENHNIENSVQVCGRLPSHLQVECYSGVFLENMTRENLVAQGIASRIQWSERTMKNQEDICRTQTELAASSCWQEMAHMYAFTSKNDPTSVYASCQKAPTQAAREDCYFHGVGIMIVSFQFEPRNMPTLCKPYSNNSAKLITCLRSAINSLTVNSVALKDRSRQLCDSLSQQHQKTCYQLLGS